jgi:hypothetical protein
MGQYAISCRELQAEGFSMIDAVRFEEAVQEARRSAIHAGPRIIALMRPTR